MLGESVGHGFGDSVHLIRGPPPESRPLDELGAGADAGEYDCVPHAVDAYTLVGSAKS